MPEYLKALVVVLALAVGTFACAKAPACAVAMTKGDFERRRNLWLSLTLVVFLAHNFWLYIFAAAALLLFAGRREPNRFAMYFFLLFAVPPVKSEISGVAAIQHFFTIDYYRVLALAVLLPAYFSLLKQPGIERFGRSTPDKLIAAYLILVFVLRVNAESITNALRFGVFYAFIDVVLPYYVASRSLRNLQDFRDALMGFVVGALVVAVMGIFETAKGWLLYASVNEALGVRKLLSPYLTREGSLRAAVSFGLAVPYGYAMAVATGMFLYVGKITPSPAARYLGWLALLAGLVAGLSRGPWVGAAVMLLVFLATGPSAITAMTKFAALGMLCLPLLAVPVGQKTVLDYLPFVGTIETANIAYRVKLIEASLKVVALQPWFGSFNAILSPEMEVLKQGSIIDVTNTYLEVVLEKGLVGLSIFVAFFVAVAAGIFTSLRNRVNKTDETHVLGQALLGTLIGILAIIATVSSIVIIPVIYWSVAGLGVAYARMLMLTRAAETAGSVALQPAAIIR